MASNLPEVQLELIARMERTPIDLEMLTSDVSVSNQDSREALGSPCYACLSGLVQLHRNTLFDETVAGEPGHPLRG